MRVVLFLQGDPLLLRNICRDSYGEVVSGRVESGGWNFEIRGDECLAKDDDFVVTRWPKPSSILEIPVGEDWQGDYNVVIERARKLYQLIKGQT